MLAVLAVLLVFLMLLFLLVLVVVVLVMVMLVVLVVVMLMLVVPVLVVMPMVSVVLFGLTVLALLAMFAMLAVLVVAVAILLLVVFIIVLIVLIVLIVVVVFGMFSIDVVVGNVDVGRLSVDVRDIGAIDGGDLVRNAGVGIKGDGHFVSAISRGNVNGQRDVGRRRVNIADEIQAQGIWVSVDASPLDVDLLAGLEVVGSIVGMDELDGRSGQSEKRKPKQKLHGCGWDRKQKNWRDPGSGK